MTLFLIKPRAALLSGTGNRILWAPLRTTGGGGPGGGTTTPLSVTGVGAYWDASVTANMLASNGAAVVGWGASVSSIADTSGNARPLVPFFGAGSGTLPVATPRLNGLLGGCGRNTIPAVNAPGSLGAGQYLPLLDPDQGFRLSGVTFGTGADWSIYLVWTRPNLRQGGSTAPVTLIAFGGVPVVQLGSTASATSLTLFPTGANVALSTAMERRHTHSLILSYSHTAGLTAYLDGNASPVVSGASAAAIGAGGVLTLLHDTTNGGGAQCWFHEAAYWPRALAGADITTLQTAASRWARGARKGVLIAVVSQSNGVNGYNAGAWHLLAQGVAWYLGAAAYGVAASPGQTLIGALGLYPVPSGDPGAGLPGTFLTNPGDGSNPSGWALDTAGGAIGAGCQSYFGGLSAADLADVRAIWWPWSETDSTRVYAEKATLYAAEQRAIALTRGFIGKAATALPWVTWNALTFPFGNDPGMQSMREVEYDLTQLTGENAWIALTNAADVNPNGATINSDGTTAGGDYSHANTPDLPKLGMRAAAVAARAILAATPSGGDTITSFPTGTIFAGGPRITHIYRQSATQYVLTIAHDTGNDLILPQQAVNGAGFALMDGGSIAAPGTIRVASACARIDATHLLVTLGTAATNAAASCLFFYPYGGARMGSGNAVTDNAASVTPPTGWDIGNQLGTAWNMNYPIAATTYGLAVSTSPT